MQNGECRLQNEGLGGHCEATLVGAATSYKKYRKVNYVPHTFSKDRDCCSV